MPDVRLINANEVIRGMAEIMKSPWFNDDEYSRLSKLDAFHIVKNLCIDTAPAIDAVHVVRCRECVYYQPKDALTPGDNRMRCNHPCLDYDIECYDQWLDVEPNDYCKYGEQKTDGGAEG